MKNHSIKKNFAYNVAYQILIMIIPLITTPYVSRVLGSTGVGTYSYSYTVANYFVILAMLGVNNYGNRTIASCDDNIEKRSKEFWSIYAFQLIMSLVMLAIYGIYIFRFCEDRVIGLIMTVFVITSALDINWFYFGIEEFKVTVIRNCVVKIISVILIFLFVKKPSDIILYSLINVVGIFLSQVILWIMIPKYIKFVTITWKDIGKHIKPNIVLFIPIVAISLYKLMDKIMLGNMSCKSEVGYYESCEKIIQIPVSLVNALGVVMLPRISNMLANNQNKKSVEYIEKSISFTFVAVTPMLFGIMSVATEFVPLFYGKGFEKCIYLYQILLPSCLFLAIANVVRTQFLIPHKKDNVYIISVFTGAFVNMIINWMLIPKFESIGAALGTLIAEAMVCIVQIVYIRKELDILQFIKANIPMLFFGIVMYLILVNIRLNVNNFLLLMIKCIVGVIVYVGLLTVYYVIKKKLNINKEKY